MMRRLFKRLLYLVVLSGVVAVPVLNARSVYIQVTFSIRLMPPSSQEAR
jgi:hypothetical protein